VKVYVYEVTSSNLPTLNVGGFVIDQEWEDQPSRTWHIWNEKTGDFTVGWTGVRRDRVCARCHGLTPRQIRAHGHDGPHGPGDQLVPTRRAEAARATTPATSEQGPVAT
jgi:hypothetical protein